MVVLNKNIISHLTEINNRFNKGNICEYFNDPSASYEEFKKNFKFKNLSYMYRGLIRDIDRMKDATGEARVNLKINIYSNIKCLYGYLLCLLDTDTISSYEYAHATTDLELIIDVLDGHVPKSILYKEDGETTE